MCSSASISWGTDLCEKLPDFITCNPGKFPDLNPTIYYIDNKSVNEKTINRFIIVLLLALWIIERNLLYYKTLWKLYK